MVPWYRTTPLLLHRPRRCRRALQSVGAGAVLLACSLLAAPWSPLYGQAWEGRRALRPLHDLGGAVVDFGVDTWEVVSAPTRWDGRAWAGFGGVVAVGGALFLADDAITDAWYEQPPSGLREGLREVGDFLEPLGLMGKTNAYYAGAATLFYFTGHERLQLLFKELLYSHWIAGGTRQLTSRLVGRVRPRDGGRARTFGEDGRSFPSGHASTIMQIAHVLSHHIDRTPASVLLYGLAGTVVFQRVDSGAHFASDAWIGAVWGVAVSSVVIRVEEEGRLPLDAELGLAPAPNGLGVRVTVPVRW